MPPLDSGILDTTETPATDTGIDALEAPPPTDAPADLPRWDASMDTAFAFDAGTACEEVDRFGSVYASTIARWSAQDALGGWPEGPVVFAGSSSIRRWEGLARAFSDYAPLQRGVGGAQLGELARFGRELVTRHAPRAVVVYAGTNDLSAGVSPGVVADRLRCLRARLGTDLGWDRPVLFIGVTPNPARWSQWPQASAFNALARAMAERDPGLTYVDVATPFLATGSPPSSSLFVSDGLHLSESGYDLWLRALRPALEAALAPRPSVSSPAVSLPMGTRVLVDLGPSNALDGEPTPSPDHLGQHWNNWHPLDGGGEVLPGEQRTRLVTTAGAPSGLDLVISGGFLANGRRNGGLLWPESARLGSLAVGSATGDYFYTEGPDAPGALFLRGLDPARTYTLRLFAARSDPEVRVTRYTVHGASTATTTLQTSGPGAGAGGADTNHDDVAVLRGLRPDPWGHLFLDVSIERGRYAYLAALELIVE